MLNTQCSRTLATCWSTACFLTAVLAYLGTATSVLGVLANVLSIPGVHVILSIPGVHVMTQCRRTHKALDHTQLKRCTVSGMGHAGHVVVQITSTTMHSPKVALVLNIWCTLGCSADLIAALIMHVSTISPGPLADPHSVHNSNSLTAHQHAMEVMVTFCQADRGLPAAKVVIQSKHV